MNRKAKIRPELKSAADNGDAEANYVIGEIYLDRAEFIQAAEHFAVAAEKRHPEALYNLALLHRFGKGVELDVSKAIKFFTEAASPYLYNSNSPNQVTETRSNACYELGQLYHMGLGVPQDYNVAIDFYEQSIGASFEVQVFPKFSSQPKACAALADLYSDEDLDYTDYQRAARYYIKAEYGGIASAEPKIKALYNKLSARISQSVEKNFVGIDADDLLNMSRASTLLLHHMSIKSQ